MLKPATNFFSLVFESPGTYQIEGELTEFLTMDVYAWGAGGGDSYGASGGGGAFVKLGGLTPPDGSVIEVTVGSAGTAGGSAVGAYTYGNIYYTAQLTGRVEWGNFLRQYAVWDGNGDYTWKSYFPVTGLYDIEMSIDDTGVMYIDNVEVHRTGNTAPNISTTVSVTVNGAGGGGGGHDAGTPGRAGYSGTRVTGTVDMILGVDTVEVDIGSGGSGGYDGSGPGGQPVEYESAIITNSLLGAASLTASTPSSPGALTFSGWEDDGFWRINLPWSVNYNQNTYGSVFVGTNSYLTFGAGSTQKTNLLNMGLDRILIGAADNSCQRIYYGIEGSSPNRTYRIRWEGTNVGAVATEQYYTAPGTYQWTCPPGVNRVAVAMVGAGGGAAQDESGGGGGGGFAWKNDIAVVPGQTYTVTVGTGGAPSGYGQRGGKGGDTTAFGVTAFGGKGTGDPSPGFGGQGGGYANADGGGVGGNGGDGNRRSIQDTGRNTGGGGAGGYTGNGGRGADHNVNNQTAGTGGAGGGGANGGPGEYGGGGGGGTGLFGLGTSGAAGNPGSQSTGGGAGGSGGDRGGPNTDSFRGGNGGFPGGGAGSDDGPGGRGGHGALRIVYNFTDAGITRQFPSTNVGTVLQRTGGTLGSPNMVWEAVFYENNRSVFDVQIGSNARGATDSTLGLYSPGNNNRLASFPAERNIGLRLTRNITTGNGGGGGTGLTYNFFNLDKVDDPTTVNSRNILGYSGFLRSFGVWEASNRNATTFDRTYNFSIPFTGYYRVRAQVDNFGYVYIDGTEVLYVPNTTQVYSQTVYLTAGTHSIRCLGTNTGGPGAFACVVEKSFSGANGGAPGQRGSSGAGGGGGAATVVRKNSTTFLAVAAGGGGGGGAGNGPAGMANEGIGNTLTFTAGAGENKIGDGGGGGGGGGGVQGGLGGRTFGGDHGAYSGEAGTSFATGLTSSSITAAGAGNAGAAGPGAWSSGRTGGAGSVVLSYVTPTGAQIYEGGAITRAGNVITHTFTTSGQFKPYSNAGYAFVWSNVANVSAGWHTIKINAQNRINFAGIGARIKQANTTVQVWTTRDEKDPTVNGTGRSYFGGPSTFATEGGQLTLTDPTANLWMSNRNAGYSNTGWEYSITREFFVGRDADYKISYMVAKDSGDPVSNVSIAVDTAILGTSTNVEANANSFTTSLVRGFHQLQITGNAGAATGNVFAALEVDFVAEAGLNLPIYSLRTDYVSRQTMRGGRGGPANRADGDGDGAFSGGDGGGASVVRMNGMYLAIAGGGGGGGGSGDDRNQQSWQAGGGGRGEGNPLSGDSPGSNGATPGTNLTPGQSISNGGGGGGGGGLNGGAGGTGAGRQVAAVGGQGGSSYVNRRAGNEWQITAGSNRVPGGTADVSYRGNFGYSGNPGRVVILFTRRPHIWQKINGSWKRFDNISYKQNSSRSQRVWNFDNENFSTGSYITGLSSQVRYYTEITGMSTPLTAAIGSAVVIFGYNTLGTGAAAIRSVTSNTKINLSAYTHLWFQVNKGTSANWGENPDSGEAVYLQYSLDGKTWVNIDGIGPSAVGANIWTTRIATVPTAARTRDGVFLRYYQTATYVAGIDIRDTWAMTSIVGLANRTDAQAANRGFDIWKGIANVWVKINGEWKRIYAQALTSSTPTPNRYG
jgi:hypothetical protein